MRRDHLLGLLALAVTLAACGGGTTTTTVATTVSTTTAATTTTTATTTPGSTTSGATVTTGATTTTVPPGLGRAAYLIVWEDGRNVSTSGWDIFGRMLGPDGVPAGNAFRVSSGSATDNEYEPAVAWNPDADEYLVVWEDGRNLDSSGIDIFGRRFGSDGKPLGGDFLVSSTTADIDEGSPAVVWNASADQYLVIWEDGRNESTTGVDIFGRRVGADGRPAGGDFRISSGDATDDETSPAIAWNPAQDQYLVVWEDGRNADTSGIGIFGRRIGADGVPVEGDFRISSSTVINDKVKPTLAWNGRAAEYFVVWEDGRNLARRGIDIVGRRVGADGAPIGGDFLVTSEAASGDEGSPALAWSQTSGNYLMVWTDSRNQATRGVDIYGMVLAPDGTTVGVEFRVSGNNATEDEGAPALIWDSADQYVVVWEDGRNRDVGGSDIFGRRFGSDGARFGTEFRISAAASNEYAPAQG